MRKCKCGCGKSIEHKHPNAKFFNARHKDKYWNDVRCPRSFYGDAGGFCLDEDEECYVKGVYEEDIHPFSGYGLGQD